MITNLTNVKAYLNISGSTLDTLLTPFISQAQKEIENYVGRDLSYGSKTIYRKLNDSTTLLLIDDIVNSLTSLSYRNTPIDTWTAIDSSKYALTQLNGNYFIYYDFGSDIEYKIVFNGGYSTYPSDLEQVAIEMVVIKLNESGAGKDLLGKGQVASAFSGTNETTTYIDMFEKRWKRVLQAYKVYLC